MNTENYQSKVDVHTEKIEKYLNVTDVDINTAGAMVHWLLEPDEKTYGIRSIMRSVTKVTLDIEWYYNIEDTIPEDQLKLVAAGGREMINGNIEGSFSIDTTAKREDGKEWTIKEEFYFKEDGQIYPNSITINFETLTITVE